MSDLAEFLLARIAEDEAKAREANGRVAWVTFRNPDGSMRYTSVAHQHHGNEGVWITDGHEVDPQGVSVFYDSRFTLAECEAKRRIVSLAHGPIHRLAGAVTEEWGAHDDTDADEDLLHLLALPYAEHEDYQQEWKP